MNFLFKQISGENNGIGSDIMLIDETEEDIPDNDPFIRCTQCLNPITKSGEEIVIDGAHKHAFANPHGILFEIVCFRLAEGCRTMGPANEEFTWFKGYAWRISVCGKCLLHLGWQYTSPGKNSFLGLIIDRLVYPK